MVLSEATNLLIKQVKPAGRGFRSFENYRLRILLAGGRRRAQDSISHEHSYSPSQGANR